MRRLIGGVAVALFVSALVRGFGVVLLANMRGTSWRSSAPAIVALGLLSYGAASPFAAALAARVGVKRLVLGALAVVSISSTAAAFTTQWWQLALVWGLGGGLATGALSTTLAANVAAHCDMRRSGLVSGSLAAINAAGALVSLPVLSAVAQFGGWRMTTSLVGGVAAAAMVAVALLLDSAPATLTGPRLTGAGAIRVLTGSARSRTFWLLAAGFTVCGATTAGIVGAHLIPAAQDRGLDPIQGAFVLAAIGLFDLVGTLVSGWVADRTNELALLASLFAMRSVALLALPFVLAPRIGASLVVVVVVLGLDWVAVTPPTIRIAVRHFGSDRAAVVFGWLAVLHQVGAAAAAVGAGAARGLLGTYTPVFALAAALCLAQGLLFLATSRRRRRTAATPFVAPAT